MNWKTAAAAVSVALAAGSLLGLAVLRNRDPRPKAVETAALPSAGARSSAGLRATQPVPGRLDRVPAAAPDETVPTISSFRGLWRALHRASALGAPDRRKALRRLGMLRSDADIDAAFARVKSRPGLPGFTSEGIQNLLLEWARTDPSAVATFLKTVPRSAGEDGNAWNLVSHNFDRWIERAPEDMLAFVKLLPGDWNLSTVARSIEFRLQLRKDPEEFLARLRTMPACEARDDAVKLAMPGWAARSPREAADWVEHLSEEGGRQEALGIVAETWARANLPSALEWAVKYVDEHLRNPTVPEFTPAFWNRFAVLTHLLEGAVESDPRWAMETARKWETGDFQPFANVIARWSTLDAVAAARYVESSPWIKGASLRDATTSVATAWAGKDPRAALAWIQQFPADADAGWTVTSVLSTWTRMVGTDPRDLMKVVENLPAEFRESAFKGLMRGWSDYDLVAAAGFLRSLPEAQQTVEVTGELAGKWATDDLEAALQWTRSTSRADLRDAALASVGATLSKTDVRRAEAVWEEISVPEIRLKAIDHLIEWSSFRNPRAASELLRKDPQASFRTYAVVAANLANKDPEGGLAWAQSLPEKYLERRPDPPAPGPQALERTLKKDIVELVLLKWHQREPAAAARWLDQAPLPKATKEELLQILPRR